MGVMKIAAAGYEEAPVAKVFAEYLAANDLLPSRVGASEQNIGEFLDFYLACDSGRTCQTDEGRC